MNELRCKPSGTVQPWRAGIEPLFVALTVCLVTLSGCSKLIANSTVKAMGKGAPALQEHWDWEFAGKAAPPGIMQMEGLLRIVPENESLLLRLSAGYVGYAYGWIEDELERTDPVEEASRQRLSTRAQLMYLRARNLAFKVIHLNTDGFHKARTKRLPDFQRWLKKHCDDEEHAAMLLWAGYAWGSAINLLKDDPEYLADLGYAKALVSRSVELDPKFYDHGGTTFLAVVKAAYPKELGGDMEGARALFEKVLLATKRRHLIVQYNYARTYAVSTANRKLFVSLLREVIDAGDVYPGRRLVNKIARRRAKRLLARVDELFLES